MSTIARIAAAGLFAGLNAGAASSGTVTVNTEKGNDRQIVVEAKDATIAEILASLNEKQAFELERLGDFANTGPQTRRYTGEFRHVLERVLENESHLVITTMSKRDVQRVVIYGAPSALPATGLKAPEPVQATPPPAAAPDGPVTIDPHVQAALDRAKKEAELAKERGELQELDPGPMRRSAMNSRGGHRF